MKPFLSHFDCWLALPLHDGLLFQLIYHTSSFAQPLSEVVMHVERGYRMDPPDGCPSEIYDVMKETWDIKPEKRPTFREIQTKLRDIQSKDPAVAAQS